MASINTWYNMLNRKNEKNGYISRRDQVQNVKNNINNVSDDYVNAINNKIDTLNSSLTSGLKGLSIISKLEKSILEKKEKIGIADSMLSCFDDELDLEVKDCQDKIESLEAEIAKLQTKYDDEVAAEQEAARKALEDVASKGKKLLGI